MRITLGKSANRLVKKRDLIHLTILSAIALGIGIYLIATTVLISKDGVLYIELAQKFSNDPIGIVKSRYPFGYPFLIFISHKFVTLLSNSSSVQTWIYSAQGVNLLCRLLALIPLYFLGKLLVGGKNSFWAVLILVILPYPAQIGSDALRDWPHILFLAIGFLILLWAARNGKWWAFGLVGLSSGIGFLISTMCGQLVVYGTLWILVSLFLSKPSMSRLKLVCALFILLSGFSISAGPYMKTRGKVPHRLNRIIKSFSCSPAQEKDGIFQEAINTDRYLTRMASDDVVTAFGEIVKSVSENLMYFFLLPWCVAFYYRFREKADYEERFFITSFVFVNVAMIVLRYHSDPDVSRRYCLPLVALTIFYVPSGLQVIGEWFENRFPMNKLKIDSFKRDRAWCFLILLLIGVSICLPKLLRPIRGDKQGYRTAAKWLQEHTAGNELIAVTDRRIYFYANRKGAVYTEEIPQQAQYVVKVVENEGEEPKMQGAAQEEFSVWVDEREKRKKLVIYRVIDKRLSIGVGYWPFFNNTTEMVFARIYRFNSKVLRWMYK